MAATLLHGFSGNVSIPDVVQSSSASIKAKLSETLPGWTTGLGRRPKKSQERITLIAMVSLYPLFCRALLTLLSQWDDDKMATYLPAFFQSARYNADSVDLLFINVLRRGDKCLDVDRLVRGASNIRVECIEDAEDKAMIRNYFCGKWDCTREQKALVDETLRDIQDPIHVQFKPWRGMIYRQWLAEDAKWWAWIDTDTVLGDFKALWPWQSIDAFDVVTISEWDYGNIYLRGQFTAFQLSGKLDDIWLEYEPLKKPENLQKLPRGAVDEFAYSVLYSNTFTDVNWILIPRALGADKFGRNKLISHRSKAFYVPSSMTRLDTALLFDARYAPASRPIFGADEAFDPKLWAVSLRELRHGDWVNGKPLNGWCDQKNTRCTVAREYYAYQSCVMQYDGQLLEYFDRRATPRHVKQDGYFGIEEKLLLHWQEIKRPAWFKMPELGVGPTGVLQKSLDRDRADIAARYRRA